MSLTRRGASSPLSLVRTAGFYLSVLVFVFFWVTAFNFGLSAVFRVWFDPVLADTTHFVHNITFHTWVWVWGVAMLVQLYRPAERVTAMQVALVLTVVDAGVSLLTIPFYPAVLVFFGPIFVAAALHPARDEVFDLAAVSRETVDPLLAVLAILAALPVLLYVAGQVNLQLTLADEHAARDHYTGMAFYGVSLVALAALTAFRNRGRRLAAYGAGLLAAMLGVVSVFQPSMSGLDTTWAVLAVLWAVVLVGAYEWSVLRRRTPRVGRSGEDEGVEPVTPT